MSNPKPKDINPVTAPQLEGQVKLQRLTKAALLVFGPSGAGKTTIMTAAAARHFDEVWLSNFSGKPPVDITGLGLPKEDEDKILTMKFSQPEGIPTVERVGDKHVYWVIDELGNADEEDRAALHGAFAPPNGQFRMVGTHRLGPNVVVGATSNLRHHGATVGRFYIPEMLRFTIVTFIPDPANWWKWGDSIPHYAATHVPAFIAYGNSVGAKAEHKNHFLGDVADFNPYVPGPLPNPRGWEEVMKVLIESNKGLVPKDDARIAIQGRVGEPATKALRAFLSVMTNKPAFEAMKRNPKGFDVPKGVDQQFMLASGAMLFAVRGISDIGAALHSGDFDWVVTAMERFTPEVGAYGLATAERRGIEVSARAPELYTELVGS